MTRNLLLPVLLIAGALSVPAQVFELGVSGGLSKMNANLIEGAPVELTDGFRLSVRATFNTQQFFGHEIGFMYSRTGVDINNEKVGFNMYSFGYSFLAYPTPEGSRVRPFAAGGVHFSSFLPPGTSLYYGNQITKFGLNYGGGVKVRLVDPWGFRVDVRQYTNGKPDLFQGQAPPSGWMRQTEISAGVTFNL